MKMNSQPINPLSLSIGERQKGFTLIEVMVALAVFAMLSVLGWQVFDSLNRSKSRAKIHADALSDIQFSYLQVQNDINQITAWQTLPLAKSLTKENKDSTNASTNNNTPNSLGSTVELNDYRTLNFFELSYSSVNFIRYADSDPRYKSSPTFVKVSYALEGESLVRHQSAITIGGGELDSGSKNSSQISSVLLTDIKEFQLHAYTPEAISSFSSQASDEMAEKAEKQKEPQLLPKGIGLSFTYRDEPISWILALPEQSPALISHYKHSEQESSQSPLSNNTINSKNNASNKSPISKDSEFENYLEDDLEDEL